jgi:hypothetical protein
VGSDEVVAESQSDKIPFDLSSDDRSLVYSVIDPKTRSAPTWVSYSSKIWILPLKGAEEPVLYSETPFSQGFARLSPNGKWLAVASNDTGRTEIYVQAFPNAGAKFQVSTNGGDTPTWSRDGKELFFVEGDRRFMSAEVDAGPRFEAAVPRLLFEARTNPNHWFDVGPDGHFLIPIPVGQSSRAIDVVINWPALLKK